MITFANRFAAVVMLAVFMLVLWVLLEVFALVPQAKASDLHVTWHPPTVSGIEQAPSPAPWYGRQVIVRSGPSAGIYDLPEPAPANGCPEPAFRVISGPQAGRGCFGHR